jgi:hypothetical protein
VALVRFATVPPFRYIVERLTPLPESIVSIPRTGRAGAWVANGAYLRPLSLLQHDEHRGRFFQAILRPSLRLTLRADYHHLRLSAPSDLWYAGGGVFESRSFGFAGRPSSGHRNLAALVDVQADFRPDQRTVLSLYIGHAHGAEVVRRIYPAGANANLAFFELSRRF